jgi:hypothetical protein
MSQRGDKKSTSKPKGKKYSDDRSHGHKKTFHSKDQRPKNVVKPPQKEINNIVIDRDITYTFEPKNIVPNKIIKRESFLTSNYEIHDTLKKFYTGWLRSGTPLTDVYWNIIRRIKDNSLNMPPPDQRGDMGDISIVTYDFFYEDLFPEELCKYVPSRVIKKIIGGNTNIKITYFTPSSLKEYFYSKLQENVEELKDLNEEEQTEIKKEIEKSISKKIEDKILEKPFPKYTFEYDENSKYKYKYIIPSKIILSDGVDKVFSIDMDSDVGKYFAEKVSRSYIFLMGEISKFNYYLTEEHIQNILSYRRATKILNEENLKLEENLKKRIISEDERISLFHELKELEKSEFERIKNKIQSEIKYYIGENKLHLLKPRWYSKPRLEEEGDIPKYKSVDKHGTITYNYYYPVPPQHKTTATLYYEQAPPENYEGEPFYIAYGDESEEEKESSKEEEYNPEYDIPEKSPYKRYDIQKIPFPGSITSLFKSELDYDKKINFHIDGLIYAWIDSNEWERCQRIYIYPKENLEFNTEDCSKVKNYFKFMYSEENIIPKIIDKYPLCEIRINKKTIHIPKVNMTTPELYDYMCLSVEHSKSLEDIIRHNQQYENISYIRKLNLYNSQIKNTQEINISSSFQEYITLWFIDYFINSNALKSVRVLFQPNETAFKGAKAYVDHILDIQFNFDDKLNLKNQQDEDDFKKMVEKYIYNDNIKTIIFFVTFNSDDEEIDSKYVLCIMSKSDDVTLNKRKDGGNIYIFDPLGRNDTVDGKYKKIYNTIISSIIPKDILWQRIISAKWNPVYSFLTYEEIEYMAQFSETKFSPKKLLSESIKWCFWFIDLILKNGTDNFGIVCTSGLNHVAKYRKHDIYFKDYIDRYITIKMDESQKYKDMLESEDETNVKRFIQNYFDKILD